MQNCAGVATELDYMQNT